MNALTRVMGPRIQKTRYEPVNQRNSGDGSHLIAQAKAQEASLRLLMAYERFFAKWEEENGFVSGAGVALLPRGFA